MPSSSRVHEKSAGGGDSRLDRIFFGAFIVALVVLAFVAGALLSSARVFPGPQIAQAFQAQSVPTVVAIVRGQPIPLYQGDYPEDQLRAVLEEVLRVAAQAGVTGTVTGGAEPQEPEPTEPPLPPLHAEALRRQPHRARLIRRHCCLGVALLVERLRPPVDPLVNTRAVCRKAVTLPLPLNPFQVHQALTIEHLVDHARWHEFGRIASDRKLPRQRLTVNLLRGELTRINTQINS